MKNKSTAGLLAIFLGGLGVHRFYLGEKIYGIVYLILSWTLLPCILSVFEGITILLMKQEIFDKKYNSITTENNSNTFLQKLKVEINDSTTPSILNTTTNKETVQSEKIKVETKENNNLNPLEKLQFKKYISEQSGMNMIDVENYLDSVTEDDKKELIISFKSNRINEIQKQDNQKQTIQTFVPTINVVQENSNIPTCPKCKSKEVAYNKKGFGAGRALGGALILGPLGLLAGATSKNKIILTCLKCGNTWKRG